MNLQHLVAAVLAPLPVVPSKTPIYKGTLTTTTDEATTTWSGQDIGTPHPKRIVILSHFLGVASMTPLPTVNGIWPYAWGRQNEHAWTAHLVPNDALATIVVSANSSVRKATSVFIGYPANHAPLHSILLSANTTTNLVLSNNNVAAGGFVIWGISQLAALSTFTQSWTGTGVTGSVTESVDAQLEATSSYAAGMITGITASRSNGLTLTLIQSTSGTKRGFAVSFGPPPLSV